jgi:hypothetical protein
MMRSVISRRELFRVLGAGAALLGIRAGDAIAAPGGESEGLARPTAAARAAPAGRRVVADPTNIPAPISATIRSTTT